MTTIEPTISTTLQLNVSKISPAGHALSAEFSSFAASCFIIIIVTSVLCNAVLISTIISVKKLHSVTHVFIINLAISDLITVLGTIPFDVEFMLRGYFAHGEIPCGVMQITFLISLPSSVLNLSLLTADRFISVIFPFKREYFLTKSKVSLAVITTWCYTFLVAFFPIMYDKNAIVVMHGMCLLAYPIAYDIFQLVANFLLPIAFICLANIMLFCVSRRHAKEIQQQSNGLGTFSALTEGVVRDEYHKKRQRKQSMTRVRKNLKAAKRVALLVGVFLFCWLTYIILVVCNISCNVCHPRELTWFGNIINYSSSAVNPLLYGWLNSSIRHEVVKKFKERFYTSKALSNSRTRAFSFAHISELSIPMIHTSLIANGKDCNHNHISSLGKNIRNTKSF